MAGAYYPSVLATLRLRFDEVFAPTIGVQLTNQPTTEQLRTAQSFDPVSERAASQLPVLMTGVKDSLSRVVNIQPRSAVVTLEAYRRAATFRLEIDYAKLPIDPRLLRSAAVEIYLDTVKPEVFADAMLDTSHTRLGTLEPSEENLLFVGTVDEYQVNHDEAGSVVTIEGRDLRGIFLDSPADPGLHLDLDLTRPIDDVVRQILERHPMGALFRTAVKAVEWPGGKVPSPYEKDGMTKVRIPSNTTHNEKGKIRAAPKADPLRVNYWDLVTQFCYVVGAIPYFHGPELRIRPVRTLYETLEKVGFDESVPSAFRSEGPDISGLRDMPEGDPPVMVPFGVRKMVVGRNVSKLRITRRFNGYKPRIIECVSLDTSSTNRGTQKLLIAGWDGEKDPWADGEGIGKVKVRNNQRDAASRYWKTNVAASGYQIHAEALRIPVPGIRDVSRLREIAKSIFEELGRGEIAGYCETKDLASFAAMPGQGGNADADMLRLRPGDPVEFLTDTSAFRTEAPVAHVMVEHAREPFDALVERVARVLGGGMPSEGDYNFARVIVATSRKQADIQTFFRVTSVRFAFEGGALGVNFDFHNYVEKRYNTRADTAQAREVDKGVEKGIGPFPSSHKSTGGRTPAPATAPKAPSRSGLFTMSAELKDQIAKAKQREAVRRRYAIFPDDAANQDPGAKLADKIKPPGGRG